MLAGQGKRLMNDDDMTSPLNDGTDSDNDDSQIQDVSKHYLSLRSIVIATLILLYGAGNVIVPSLLWNLGNDTIVMFFIGALAAEIGRLDNEGRGTKLLEVQRYLSCVSPTTICSF
jgi:hypothetical protein